MGESPGSRSRPSLSRFRGGGGLDSLASLCLLLASLAGLAAASYRALFNPLEYDEAYNLQVVDTLARGGGYASYGALDGAGPRFFDSHITTGPAVLLPLALVWRVSDGSVAAVRAFMLAFPCLLVTGLHLLFRRPGGSSLLSALAVATTLSIHWLPAGRVLGELPAAAVMVWAALALARNRPLLAGFAVGMAIQIKFVYALAGCMLLGAWLAAGLWGQERKLARRALLVACLVLAPAILFEGFRFLHFGNVRDYLGSVREFEAFLRSQNVNRGGTWLNPAILGAKAAGLVELLPTPALFATAGLGALGLAGAVAALLARPRGEMAAPSGGGTRPAGTSRLFFASAVIGLMASGLALLIGWVTQSTQAGARQGLPFLLLFLPCLSALGGFCYLSCREERSLRGWRVLPRAVVLCSVAGLLVTLCEETKLYLTDRSYAVPLREQREVAGLISRSGAESVFVDGWWQNPEYLLLGGLPGVPRRTGSSQLLIVQDYQLRFTGTDWAAHRRRCAEVLYAGPGCLVCRLPPLTAGGLELQVMDWGPRAARAGSVPNEQPDGGMGLWIRFDHPELGALGPLRVLFAGHAAPTTHVHRERGLVTTSIPRSLVLRSGSHEVTLEETGTGATLRIGSFEVE